MSTTIASLTFVELIGSINSTTDRWLATRDSGELEERRLRAHSLIQLVRVLEERMRDQHHGRILQAFAEAEDLSAIDRPVVQVTQIVISGLGQLADSTDKLIEALRDKNLPHFDIETDFKLLEALERLEGKTARLYELVDVIADKLQARAK